MRIITLLARHGAATYGSAVGDIDGLFARQMPNVAHDLLIVDNSLPRHHHERLAPGRELIGAPNTHWEFSAWEHGMSYLGGRMEQYDFVHLATSAFRTLYTRYLDRFDVDMLGLIRGRGAAVGHIDYYNVPVTIGDRSVRSWLRSSFVFLPPVELRLLGSLVSIDDPQPFFSGNPESPFRSDAPLSTDYRHFIIGWLTGRGTGQGVEWHSRFELTEQTLSLFEAKAMAILNEHMLSSRLRVQGCALVDTTWLAARCALVPAGEPLGAIPGWRWQVIRRDVDAAPRSLVEPNGSAD
jgi:hypothetical protein